MTTRTTTNSKLPLRTKLLFSTGDLSTSIPLAILMFFQLYFLTDVAGLRPDYAGWAIGASRLWDAVNDPLFGLLSDRIRTRWGRRRVLLLFGAVPLGVFFMLMWIVPALDQVWLAVYYAMTFIILATVLGWNITDNRLLYLILGVGLGIISIIPPLIVFSITRERTSDELPESLPLKQALRQTLSNQPFRMVMGLYLLSWTTASIIAAVLVYFANYYLRVPEQANYFVLAAQGSAILFIPVIVKLSQRLDKRRAFIIGSLTWVIVLLGISALRADQVGLAYLLAALAGFGIATAYVVPWSMVPDVVEYDEIRSGQRREGSYYAFASFFQKLATGVALWGMGQALAMTGYITPPLSGPLPVQPEAAVNAIRIFTGPIPAVLLFLAVLFAWKYSITRESHQATLQELAERET